MITPEDITPFNEDEADDQVSQQDVQSDGIDPIPASEDDKEASDLDNLSQADKASESSFTLNVDKGIAPGKPDRQ
ncbi:hypothetical protein [Pedobacter sp. L105]|uniref:hypothetical protein n=1 Tax=Pedobacter sp. L105 TaxID=1641871 RepID=UPI00131AA806|nr:hypothetical protein [Pedobacter sp. L105]